MTARVHKFREANAVSPVVYGAVICPERGGGIFRLANDQTFRLTAEECRMVKPRWAFEIAA